MGLFSSIGKAIFGGSETETNTFDVEKTINQIGSQNDLFRVNTFGDQDEQDAMNQFYSGEEIDGVRGKVLQKKMSRSLHFCQLCQNMHALDEECEE